MKSEYLPVNNNGEDVIRVKICLFLVLLSAWFSVVMNNGLNSNG